MTTKEQIVNILTQVKPTKSLEQEKNIIENGYLDSFELMALIAQISEEFGIEIGVDEIVPENFNSVDAMAAMVENLKK